MKKIIGSILFTALYFFAVSCTVDSFDEHALKPTKFKESVENTNFGSRDSIPPDHSSTIGQGDGPGDGVFPIKPPKK